MSLSSPHNEAIRMRKGRYTRIRTKNKEFTEKLLIYRNDTKKADIQACSVESRTKSVLSVDSDY
jgi:hypothetical protein